MARDKRTKTCCRVCVDDSIRFMAFCQLLAGIATSVFAIRMIVRDDVFRDGEWRHMSETWFIHAVNVYAFMLLTCGIVGLVGGGSCKGFCLDLHAFLAISLVALEGVLVGMYVVDRNAFDGIAQKDSHGDLSDALGWIKQNQVGSLVIISILCALQILSFLLSWSVRLCCNSQGADEEAAMRYEYAPLPQDAPRDNRRFVFSSYSPEGEQASRRFRAGSSEAVLGGGNQSPLLADFAGVNSPSAPLKPSAASSHQPQM